MTGRMRIAVGIAAVAAIAPAQADPVPSRAATVAALLASADAATALPPRDRARVLRQTLGALDRLGAHAGPNVGDPLPDWRIAAGPSAAPPLRGRVLGPAFRRGWMAPGTELRIEQLFLGGQPATVAVAASPRQPVQLSVTGPDASRPCTGPQADCRWFPIFTQRYVITVRNVGAAPAQVYLVLD